MPRPARFSSEQIIAAAAEVAAKHGPAAASVARIARRLRAPTGSIYHRFPSRSVLLGEAWLSAAESFQSRFAQVLRSKDAKLAGLQAVQFLVQQVFEEPQQARLLMLHRREDFQVPDWPRTMADRARSLDRQLNDELHDFGQRLLGRVDNEILRVLSFALAQAPLAAVKPHIAANQPVPPIAERMIESTYWASMKLLGVKR